MPSTTTRTSPAPSILYWSTEATTIAAVCPISTTSHILAQSVPATLTLQTGVTTTLWVYMGICPGATTAGGEVTAVMEAKVTAAPLLEMVIYYLACRSRILQPATPSFAKN